MSDQVSRAGIDFTGLLTVVFITLKLLGKITWSWWWVVSPIWIPAAGIAVGALVVFLIALIVDG